MLPAAGEIQGVSIAANCFRLKTAAFSFAESRVIAAIDADPRLPLWRGGRCAPQRNCNFAVARCRLQRFQKSRDAIRAPSAIAAIFAHTTSGSTAACPTHVPKPQSLPAITFSRPTRLA